VELDLARLGREAALGVGAYSSAEGRLNPAQPVARSDSRLMPTMVDADQSNASPRICSPVPVKHSSVKPRTRFTILIAVSLCGGECSAAFRFGAYLGSQLSHTAVGTLRGRIAVTLPEEFSMPSTRILPGACTPMLACYVIEEQATPAA
jgi:hypothetical protein